MKRIAKYQFITTDTERHSHADLAELACLGGAGWVQLRVKNKDDEEWCAIAEEVRDICRKYQATFIINDNVALASSLDADGVHLGRNDMPIKEARNILGPDKIIGGTANTAEDIINLARQGADYVGLGPYRFTDTKENLDAILGLQDIKLIVAESQKAIGAAIPIVAVGGIKRDDILPILQAGLFGCAVSGAVVKSEYMIIASAKFAHQLRTIAKQLQNASIT